MHRSIQEIREQAEQLAVLVEDFEINPLDEDGAIALAALHRAVICHIETEIEIVKAISQALNAHVRWGVVARELSLLQRNSS